MFKKLSIMVAMLLVWPCMLWAQGQDFHVINVDTSLWPQITLTVAVPEGEMTPRDYSLTLDGQSTQAARIEGPLDADLRSMVVAVDTSKSLSPEHLEAAKDALGAYVEKLDSGEQLALLGFNDNVQLASGFTADRDVFINNLEGLSLAGTKTELYRSLLYGAEIMKNMPGRHHLLVLSDGHDEGSGITLEQVVQRAKEANIKISAVGIPGTPSASGDRYVENLRALAAQTGGIYLHADTAAELQSGLRSLLDQQRAMARMEEGRIYNLTFDMEGVAPRSAVNADLLLSNPAGVRSASFYLPAPPADMVAMASGSRFWLAPEENRNSQGLSPVAAERYPSEMTESETVATLTDNWRDSTIVSQEVIEPETAVSASADSDREVVAPYGAASTMSTPFWKNPLFWLLLALALGILAYYYWRNGQYRNRDDAYSREGYDLNSTDRDDCGLYTLEFPETGQQIPLHQGVISVGSAPNNNIVVEEITVSPRHAEIYVSGDNLYIKNLDAVNRTTINGNQVSTGKTTIKPGDKLLIGRTIAFFRKAARDAFPCPPKTVNN